jgi:hypothetical protein
MDTTFLSTGPAPLPDELAIVSEFIRGANAGELATLVHLFSSDAQVNDQLRNFWGIAEITHWLEREIIGEQVRLRPSRPMKHYGVVILNAEISGNFEVPREMQPMRFDLHFTVQNSKIVRLLILLARDDTAEAEIRPVR